MKKIIIILGTILLAVGMVTTIINGDQTTSLKSGANTVVEKSITVIDTIK